MTRAIFKTTLLINFFSFFACYSQQPTMPMITFTAPGTPEIRGYIKILGHTGPMPQFRVLFNAGKETMSNREGFFTFPIDDSTLQNYSLVICKKIKHVFDKKNTLKYLSVDDDTQYRLFSFTKIAGRWNQREEMAKEPNFVLPSNSIVLLIDPKCVDEVKPWNIDLPAHIIKLPVIVLKNDVDQKRITRCSAKSLLYSLDAATFHEPIREAIKPPEQGPNVRISRVQ